eukprot:TRINITY_DN1696_c0_g1_i6.p1 TRINITY_DN1696_c0_g1~~TRINITY_DN1696_c0_g1_i6.p1  ORF type:complete len:352 (-),score=109.59 TRINITY_DN1696_c0_g1_i6:332-1387(-)
MTGLSEGTTYYVKVAAVNAIGTGSDSSSISPSTDSEPGAKDIVGLGWTEKLTGSTSNAFTLSGLEMNVTYSVSVAGVNEIGVGGYSSVVASKDTLSVSGSPNGVFASVIEGYAITMNWTAPYDNGDSAITSYWIEVTATGKSPQLTNTGSTGLSYRLSGLEQNTEYSIRVRSENGVGMGVWSKNVKVLTHGLPSAPSCVSVRDITHDSATIEWCSPLNNGRQPITLYQVDVSLNSTFFTANGAFVFNGSTNGENMTIGSDSLSSGSRYFVRVGGKNSVGLGSYNSTVSFTTASSPSSESDEDSPNNDGPSAGSIVVIVTAFLLMIAGVVAGGVILKKKFSSIASAISNSNV